MATPIGINWKAVWVDGVWAAVWRLITPEVRIPDYCVTIKGGPPVRARIMGASPVDATIRGRAPIAVRFDDGC